MSRARAVTFVPRNRLSAILAGEDGVSFADHISRAEAELTRVAPTLAAGLHDAIAALADLCRREEDVVFQACREIGHLALVIVETARLANRPDIASVAEGVWELITALTSRGVWHTQALRVHAEALATLASPAFDGPGQQDIAFELARLRAAIGATAPSD